MKIVITAANKTDVRWEINWEEHRDDGFIQPMVLTTPLDTMEWRAAEYNIDPADYDTLVDIMICERYMDNRVITGPQGLFYAPDIETARTNYLAEIAKIKLKYRISTRGKDHPLNLVRQTAEHNGETMAIKGLEVLLVRHNNGAQVLDPAVHAVLARVKENIVITGG